MKQIFISKDANELETLNELMGNRDFRFECKSLIDFKSLSFDLPNDFEVVFFSSIRSAKFLSESKKINLDNYSIACAGSQTALKLNEMGLKPDFIASNASNPKHVSEEFSTWLGARKVFIPSSNRSLRSIEESISAEQIKRAILYETLLLPLQVVSIDILVFTSPSNVHAYFINNEILEHSIVIAWGHSTKRALLGYGCESGIVLRDGTISELKSILESML